MAKRGRALLLQLMKQMAQVEIETKYLPKDGRKRRYGECTPYLGKITVNPVPSIVDTLIHELLHSLHPEYSETTVRRLTSRLCRSMTDAETIAFWEALQEIAPMDDASATAASK